MDIHIWISTYGYHRVIRPDAGGALRRPVPPASSERPAHPIAPSSRTPRPQARPLLPCGFRAGCPQRHVATHVAARLALAWRFICAVGPHTWEAPAGSRQRALGCGLESIRATLQCCTCPSAAMAHCSFVARALAGLLRRSRYTTWSCTASSSRCFAPVPFPKPLAAAVWEVFYGSGRFS